VSTYARIQESPTDWRVSVGLSRREQCDGKEINTALRTSSYTLSGLDRSVE
jgi:hypothetical protein